MPDAWNPGQYERFAAERSQPFYDLMSLLEPVERPAVVDIGCGTGKLTAELHAHLGASETLGVDSSVSMLAEAPAGIDGLSFDVRDGASFEHHSEFDVVFSNAALQWMPRHHDVICLWGEALKPGGQLAIQMPSNADHPSHLVSSELSHDPDFADEFAAHGGPPPDPVHENVLAPEAYASLLYDMGCERQHVRLQVYGHVLPSSADVVEWVKGTSLTRFQSRLAPETFERFVEEYRRRLLAVIGEHSPYFYPFKRILIWGRLPA